MPGPVAKDPETRQRTNKSSTKALLKLVVDHEIPPMPPAEDWLVSIFTMSNPETDGRTKAGKAQKSTQAEQFDLDDEQGPAVWNPAVVRWWGDIWSSPMSNEFNDADVHGLYLACFYLQQTLNPLLKMSDRLNASKSYEAAVKNFGLTPMSRRALQWEIEKVDAAQHEGNIRRKRAQDDSESHLAKEEASDDPREAEDEDDQNPFDITPAIAIR